MRVESPKGDPILALLPAEHQYGFDSLPFEEQQWRARIFLAVWIESGQATHASARMAFAWHNAMMDYTKDPETSEAEVRGWVLANLTDEVIRDGLASLQTPEEEPSA